MSRADLDDLGRRIEQLTAEPDGISAPVTGVLSRIFGSFLYRIGWQPGCEVQAVRALLGAMGQGQPEDAALWLRRAIDELDDNVRAIERATVIEKRALPAHARWLRRVYEVVVRCGRALDQDAPSARLARVVDDALLAPPLFLGTARPVRAPGREAGGQGQETGGQTAGQTKGQEVGGGDEGQESARAAPSAARLLELRLDTIDHLLDAARTEYRLFARKRRLLEAARQLLLETSAALDLDAGGVHARAESIARQITRLDRMEALGLRGDVDLVHQARAVLVRGQRDALYAALQAIEDSALARPDGGAVAALAGRALGRLAGDRREDQAGKQAPLSAAGSTVDSMVRSAREIFGDEVVQHIEAGFQSVRASAKTAQHKAVVLDIESWMVDLFRAHIAPGAERAVLAAALAVDGCFDLGGAASPVRVREQHIVRTAVPYPTQELAFAPAETPADLGDAVIGDPRTVLLDLAAGRLLARRYILARPVERERTVLQGEVRVYVLDGSTSMLGPRAYMRDAILIAELCTLMKRMVEQAHETRLTLFYRYFTRILGDIARVDSAESALEAVREVMENPRTGGTDIEAALLASMDTVRQARAEDPDLARAQIVLVTDGAAPVSEARVTEAREAVGRGFPLGVSVIALGEENRALRRLVARQRALGERAFYHFLPDAFLAEIARGDMDGDRPLHLAVPAVPWAKSDGAAPDQELEGILDELADLERVSDRASLMALDEAERARRGTAEPEELDERDAAGEGARANLEAVHRDHRALGRRFARWFPPPAASEGLPVMPPEPGTEERDDLDAVLVLLATIAEVVELADHSEATRQADAIDLLARMLPDASLSATRYYRVLHSYPAQVATMLQALHASVRWGAFWRIEVPHLEHPAR